MLDLAQRAWPEVDDRKQLLYRLARVGEGAVRDRVERQELTARRGRQHAALERANRLVDVDSLLSDEAWR
jgi:hypothetical protein